MSDGTESNRVILPETSEDAVIQVMPSGYRLELHYHIGVGYITDSKGGRVTAYPIMSIRQGGKEWMVETDSLMDYTFQKQLNDGIEDATIAGIRAEDLQLLVDCLKVANEGLMSMMSYQSAQ